MYNTKTTTNNKIPENVSSYPYPLHHHHLQPIMMPLSPPPPYLGPPDDQDDFPRRDERFPQWSYGETRDFIEIRSQLEMNFNMAKRNKNLWEMVASRMGEKGYRRTVDQCKGKWKNLVTRYKVQETSDLENGRQCPFFDELHALFTAKANMIEPPQPDLETSSSKGKKRRKNTPADQSHEEFLEEDQEDDEETDFEDQAGKAPKRKATRVEKRQKAANLEKISGQPLPNNTNDNIVSGLREILTSFMHQQQMIDMQWKESMEKRAHEKEVFEQEWRETMEKLERERLMMEKAWREREEQRRLREESRAEKRDALLTMLLNKLIHEENQ